MIQDQVRFQVALAIEAVSAVPQAAIDIFITTIGVIEPSVVLCRFFQPNQTRYLSQYLIELHKRGYANADHTRLLFTLFHLNEQRGPLNDFIAFIREAKASEAAARAELAGPVQPLTSIFAKQRVGEKKKLTSASIIRFLDNFKASVAVDTLIENDLEDPAFEISKIMEVSKQIVALLITSQGKYAEAARVLSERALDEDGRDMLLEFGPLLLSREPATVKTIETTAVALWIQPNEQDDVSFLRLFWGCPSSAKSFLSTAIHIKPTQLFLNSYLQLLISRPNGTFFGSPETADTAEALKILSDPEVQIPDIDPLLTVCRNAGFTEGVLALLKRKKRNSEVAALYISLLKDIEIPADDALDRLAELTRQFVSWIETNPEVSGDDWITILRFFVELGEKIPPDLSEGIFAGHSSAFVGGLVSKALTARSLFSLIEELCQNESLVFEVVQHPLNAELNRIIRDLADEEGEHQRLNTELEQLEREIDRLESDDIEVKPFYCDKCGNKVGIPYLAFFCGHRVHAECCAEGDPGIPACPLCEWVASPMYSVAPDATRELQLPTGGQPDLLEHACTMIRNGYFSE
jgi:predicted Zn-ribbon and HTH transcriptional regulator